MKFYSMLMVMLFSFISGCSDESKQSVNKDPKMVTPEANQMRPLILGGMYIYSQGAGKFYDCNSDKTFFISEVGESASIEKAYVNIPDKKEEEKVYVELEAFISTQSKSESPEMDSILVVTRFFKLDRAMKCE